MSLTCLAIALLLSYGCFVVLASPVSLDSDPQSSIIRTRSDALGVQDACAVVGNPDLYGLGIRVGVYTQLLSSVLANHYHDESVKDTRDTNTIFLIAIFVAILRATVTGDIQPLEAFIMLQILFTFLLSVFTVNMSPTWVWVIIFQARAIRDMPTDWRSLILAHQKFSDVGTVARSCLQIAISSYAIWFWFRGVESLASSETCTPVAFLIVPIHLNGGALRFYQAFVILYFYYVAFPYGYISSGLSFIVHYIMRQPSRKLRSVASYRGQWRRMLKGKCGRIFQSYISMSLPKDFPKDFPVSGKSELDSKDRKPRRPGDNKKYKRRLSYFRLCMVMMCLAVIMWSIVTIELTLTWSNFTGVNGILSVGQLIPAIIGVSGLLRIVHLIIIKRASEAREMALKRRLGGTLDPKTAKWQFCLRDGRIARFQASRLERGRFSTMQLRRWSEDGFTGNDLKPSNDDFPTYFARDDLPPPPPDLQPRTSEESSGGTDISYLSSSSARSSSRGPSEADSAPSDTEIIHHRGKSRIQILASPKFLAKAALRSINRCFRRQRSNHTKTEGHRKTKVLQIVRRKIYRPSEWRYPLKSGKVQVFGSSPIMGSSMSLDKYPTRKHRALPHIIDAPIYLKESKAHQKERDDLQRDLENRRQAAWVYRKLRREKSPCYKMKWAQWRYRLRDSRTQVFYCNNKELLRPEWRRASFDSPKYVDITNRYPHMVVTDIGGPVSSDEEYRIVRKRHRRSRMLVGILCFPFLAVIEFVLFPIVLAVLILLLPLIFFGVSVSGGWKSKDHTPGAETRDGFNVGSESRHDSRKGKDREDRSLG